jgi:hypothetical protein
MEEEEEDKENMKMNKRYVGFEKEHFIKQYESSRVIYSFLNVSLLRIPDSRAFQRRSRAQIPSNTAERQFIVTRTILMIILGYHSSIL